MGDRSKSHFAPESTNIFFNCHKAWFESPEIRQKYRSMCHYSSSERQRYTMIQLQPQYMAKLQICET